LDTILCRQWTRRKADHLFTNQLKTTVYSKPKGEDGRKVVARLFMDKVAQEARQGRRGPKIRFREGEGYAKEGDFGEGRTMKDYFIDVGQGDDILVQTSDDRRSLIDGGKNGGAHSSLKSECHLQKHEKILC